MVTSTTDKECESGTTFCNKSHDECPYTEECRETLTAPEFPSSILTVAPADDAIIGFSNPKFQKKLLEKSLLADSDVGHASGFCLVIFLSG